MIQQFKSHTGTGKQGIRPSLEVFRPVQPLRYLGPKTGDGMAHTNDLVSTLSSRRSRTIELPTSPLLPSLPDHYPTSSPFRRSPVSLYPQPNRFVRPRIGHQNFSRHPLIKFEKTGPSLPRSRFEYALHDYPYEY